MENEKNTVHETVEEKIAKKNVEADKSEEKVDAKTQEKPVEKKEALSDDEIIDINKEEEYSKIEINSDVGLLKIVINQTGKSLFINNNPIKKTSEYIGKLNAILFKPSDLELFSTVK